MHLSSLLAVVAALSIGVLAHGHTQTQAQPQSAFHLSEHLILNEGPENLLDGSFDDWLSEIDNEWNINGLHVAVVRRLKSGAWATETKVRIVHLRLLQVHNACLIMILMKGYGVANEAGDPVTSDVGSRLSSNCYFAP